jgi:drug/metabolite transporter (DMT)-like permease
MALGGAVAVSVYLIGGRTLRRSISLIPYVFCVYAVASLLLLTACLVLGVELSGFTTGDYLLLIALGIVPSHLGHTLYNYLLRYVDAKVVAVSTLGEPILSSVLAFLILSELPQSTIFLGAPMVLLGICLTAMASARSI